MLTWGLERSNFSFAMVTVFTFVFGCLGWVELGEQRTQSLGHAWWDGAVDEN
jgi:hypothetical protein